MSVADVLFTASWSRATWITTLAVTVAILGAGVLLLIIGVKQIGMSRGRGVACMVLAALDIGLLLFTAALAPRGYTLTSSSMVIKRAIRDVSIRLSDVSSVTTAEPGMLTGSIRLMASGGVFGFFGKFKSSRLGVFDEYVTRWDRSVIIKRKSAPPVVVSPDRPVEFVKAVRAHLMDNDGM